MYRNASIKQEELWKSSGAAFDKAYAQNEVAFHEAVNGALESTLTFPRRMVSLRACWKPTSSSSRNTKSMPSIL
jgi:predicted outer membrane protein